MGQETNPIYLFSWGWIEAAHDQAVEGLQHCQRKWLSRRGGWLDALIICWYEESKWAKRGRLFLGHSFISPPKFNWKIHTVDVGWVEKTVI